MESGLEVSLILSLIGIPFFLYLLFRVCKEEITKSNTINVSNQCDRQLIEKVLKLPESSRVMIENEIDAGLHDDESS